MMNLLPCLFCLLVLLAISSAAAAEVPETTVEEQPKVHRMSARRAAIKPEQLGQLPDSIWRQLPGHGRFGSRPMAKAEQEQGAQQTMGDFRGFILYGEVKVGSPGQPLQLGFAFHRDQMWVFGERANPPTNKVWHKVTKFQQSKSSTFKEGILPFSLPLWLATGKYAHDMVQVAGKMVDMQFGVCNSASPIWGFLPLDGELGLSPNPADSAGIQSPLNRLLTRSEKPLLSLWVDRQSMLSDGRGALTLGALDGEHCKADWAFVDMTDTGGWHFGLSGISLGKNKVDLKLEKVRLSDENHVIVGPRSQVRRILEPLGAVEGHLGSWHINCEARDSAPDLVFHLGAKGQAKVAVPADTYIVEVPKATKCVLAVMSYPDPLVSLGWVMGESFYDGRCLALDWTKKQIGFATAK